MIKSDNLTTFFLQILRSRLLFRVFAVGFISYIAALAMLFGIGEYILFLIAGCSGLYFYFKTSHVNRIYLLIFSIGIPLPIMALGRDLGTLPTFLILITVFVLNFVRLIKKEELNYGGMESLVLVMIFWGLVCFLLGSKAYIITGFRYYLIFLSGLLIFLLIIKFNEAEEKVKFIFSEKFLNVIFLLVIIQIIIGTIIYFIPEIGKIFSIFTPRSLEGIEAVVTDRNVLRLKSLIAGPEGMGELIAVLSPLVLYKYFKTSKLIYLITMFLFMFCQVLTGTRSTTLLCIFGIMVTLSYYVKTKNFAKIIIFFGCLIIFVLISCVIFTHIYSDLFYRFTLLQNNLQRGYGFAAAINRDTVWLDALTNIKKTTLLGTGFLPPHYYLGTEGNFHNLYLTVIFRMGWLGAGFFFIFLFLIIFRLLKAFFSKNAFFSKDLIFCSTLGMFLFLINEIKFEFNRHASYQQLILVILGYFFVISSQKLPSNKRKINNV